MAALKTELGTLAGLELRSDELNLIIVGPGYGEAIAVDLPGPGWLIIDGAGRKDDFPLIELLADHIGEQHVEALVLTHPHRDHYHGMLELIDHQTLGARIDKIGCVEDFVSIGGGRPAHSWAFESDAGDRRAAGPASRIAAKQARTLLRRIYEIWTEEPDRRLSLRRGPLKLANPMVQARVLAPDDKAVSTSFDPKVWRAVSPIGRIS